MYLQDFPEKICNPILSEEAKLKAKYPNLGQKPGGSDFLMKRLQKGVSRDRSLNLMLKRSSSNVDRTFIQCYLVFNNVSTKIM